MTVMACVAQGTEEVVELPREPKVIDVSEPDVRLQPFSVRMSKLSHVLELPLTDPLFDELFQQRFALGDHDYARALRPDRRWSARRMGIWIKALLPICESPEFAALYPNVAIDPDALVLKAYGRPADATDRMAVSDDDTAVCLALLSALEFVAQ